MKDNSFSLEFSRLQRAAVVMEIGVAVHNGSVVSQAMLQVEESLKLIKEMLMGKDGKNYTTKPIPDGTKVPQDNRGTKPNPEGGSTTGRGNEAPESKEDEGEK